MELIRCDCCGEKVSEELVSSCMGFLCHDHPFVQIMIAKNVNLKNVCEFEGSDWFCPNCISKDGFCKTCCQEIPEEERKHVCECKNSER